MLYILISFQSNLRIKTSFLQIINFAIKMKQFWTEIKLLFNSYLTSSSEKKFQMQTEVHVFWLNISYNGIVNHVKKSIDISTNLTEYLSIFFFFDKNIHKKKIHKNLKIRKFIPLYQLNLNDILNRFRWFKFGNL
jgi:hypothetical protein